jgi:hypothetical protein
VKDLVICSLSVEDSQFLGRTGQWLTELLFLTTGLEGMVQGTREKVRLKRINLEGNTHAQEINVSQCPV